MNQRLSAAILAIMALAVAAIPITAAFDSLTSFIPILGAVILPFLIVYLGKALGVRRWGIAGAGVALPIAFALSVIPSPTQAGDLGWRARELGLFAPLLDSVPRLLTAPRPAPSTIEMLVPVVLLVWMVALVIALITLFSATVRSAVLIGAALIYLAGALLTAGAGDPLGVIAAIVVLVLVFYWVFTPDRHPLASKPQRGGSRLATAVAIVISCVALVAVAIPVAAPFEPRTLVQPPQLPAAATHPIPQVTAWSQRGDAHLFTVWADEGQVPERLVLTALPDYDGSVWRLDARLRAIGVVDEQVVLPGDRQLRANLSMEIGDLDGIWLPSVGMTQSVQGVAPIMDVETGALVVPEGLRRGLAASISGDFDSPLHAEIARAGVPPVTDIERYLELPRLPDELREEALEMTAGATSRLEQALAIEAGVRQDRIRDDSAQSGSSYGRLMEFLFLPEEEGGQVGTREQFSAAFAVLARSVGLPTRLVVGFDLNQTDATGNAADPISVLGTHASVWPEVYFANAGWVAFAPSPGESTLTPPPSAPVEEEEGELLAPTPTPTAQQETDAADEEVGTDRFPVQVILIGVGLVFVVAIVLLGILLTARMIRRNQWRRAGARGGWAHVLDALSLAGEPSGPGAVPADIAKKFDGEQQLRVLELARAAEFAAFGPDQAADDAGASADVFSSRGESGWSVATNLETDLRKRLPWWQRAWWWFSPRVVRK